MQDTLVTPGTYRGAPIPWWGKIAAKVILSRLPVPHELWTRLNVFRHSYSSQDADQLARTVEARVGWFRSRTGRVPRTVLELGPGEITPCAVAYKALGVERTIFVDVSDYGTNDLTAYERIAASLSKRGLSPPSLAGAAGRADVFRRCGAEYHTDGLKSLRRLPDATADLVTSVAVIEHIRRDELGPTFDELARIMTGDGLAWHGIDFQDHLGGKLANLRFAPSLWESRWMSSSGFYTNRLSASQVVALLQRSGLAVEIEARGLWPQPPIARRSIAAALREAWTNEDLRVASMSVSAAKRAGSGPAA